MEKIYKKDDELLSYEARKEILKKIGQKDLLKIFDNYKPKYRPVYKKQSPLDQQISLGVSKSERQIIANEIKEIKKTNSKATISALIRSRAIGEVDLESWREKAIIGLKELNSIKWDKSKIEKKLRQTYKQFDNIVEDEESAMVLNKKIKLYEARIKELSRPTIRRSSRMSGRLTFSEANLVRWRAGRLTITVADYMRFLIFGYLPFTENDRHLSIDARRRFYISILDVSKNGWGAPAEIEECPNCARYAYENRELRSKLERLRKLSS